MSLPKAIGSIGGWFATVNGREYPVVHDYWTETAEGSMKYHDEKLSLEHPKVPKFVNAIRDDGKVVLQKSKVKETRPDGTILFERIEYIALFEVEPESVIHDDQGLRFTITSRLLDLA